VLNLLQKYAPIISISLLIILLVALIFQLGSAQTLSTLMIAFGLGTAILFTVYGNWETKKNDELTNAQFARNVAIDLLGLALIMLSAMWLGRMAVVTLKALMRMCGWGAFSLSWRNLRVNC